MSHDRPQVRVFRASHVFTAGEIRTGLALEVDRSTGLIRSLAPLPEAGGAPGVEVVDLGGRVLIPGAVNSHAHAFQVLLRGRADDARSFRDWVDGHLYALVESLDGEDLETAMLLAFAQMALSGTTAVGEFFYVHDGRGNALDDLAIRCARRVGLRVALLRAMYDRGSQPAQRRFREPLAEAVANVRALAAAWRTDPLVSVAPAPHSLHGASAEMIQEGCALADALDVPFHIHLAEERDDLEVARDLYGTTPLRALAELGALTRRLVVVHGCWLDRRELELLGAARAGLAHNPSANMFLGDGFTSIETAIEAGACVSLGCDGPGGNNRVDVFAEMRAAELLARVRLLRMGVLAPLAPEDPFLPFTLGTLNGARNLGIPAGELAPGRAADFVALDPEDLSLAPHHGVETRVFLRNLVHAGDLRPAIREVYVAGEPIVARGRLCRVDGAEIRERVRRWEHKPHVVQD